MLNLTPQVTQSIRASVKQISHLINTEPINIVHKEDMTISLL